MLDFNDLFEDKTKYGTKLKTDQYQENGKNIIVDQGQNDIAGYTNMEKGLFTDVPAIIFGDHTRVVKYIDQPFFLGADGTKILKSKYQDANYKYLYYALKYIKIPNTGYNRHYKWLKELKFKYPAKEEQKQIVFILDKIGYLIQKNNSQLELLDELIKARFVEMFGEPILNDKGWDKNNLSNLIEKANNGLARRGKDKNGEIVLRLVELQSGFIDYSNPNRIILNEKEKNKYLLKENDFLFARVNGNPENVGRCAVFREINEPVYHNDHIIRIHFKNGIFDGTYLCHLLNSSFGKRQIEKQIKTSAGQYTISQEGIGAIVAIIPPIELQNRFAGFVHQVDKSR